jgi:hypothetical protein
VSPFGATVHSLGHAEAHEREATPARSGSAAHREARQRVVGGKSALHILELWERNQVDLAELRRWGDAFRLGKALERVLALRDVR